MKQYCHPRSICFLLYLAYFWGFHWPFGCLFCLHFPRLKRRYIHVAIHLLSFFFLRYPKARHLPLPSPTCCKNVLTIICIILYRIMYWERESTRPRIVKDAVIVINYVDVTWRLYEAKCFMCPVDALHLSFVAQAERVLLKPFRLTCQLGCSVLHWEVEVWPPYSITPVIHASLTDVYTFLCQFLLPFFFLHNLLYV